MSVSHGLLHRIWLGIEQPDEKVLSNVGKLKKSKRCSQKLHKNN